MNLRIALFTATLATVAMCFAGTAQAQTQPQSLVITEYSSTDLTAVLNGTQNLSVHQSGSDSWSFALPTVTVGSAAAVWDEPDGNGLNRVDAPGGATLFVSSDISAQGFAPYANDTTDTADFNLAGTQLNVTFNDLGDSSDSPAAPESTSTFVLLGLSLAGLGLVAKARVRTA